MLNHEIKPNHSIDNDNSEILLYSFKVRKQTPFRDERNGDFFFINVFQVLFPEQPSLVFII